MNDGSLSDDELADLLIERLIEFAPALSIKDGDDPDQVEIHITMSRIPVPVRGHGPDPFGE